MLYEDQWLSMRFHVYIHVPTCIHMYLHVQSLHFTTRFFKNKHACTCVYIHRENKIRRLVGVWEEFIVVSSQSTDIEREIDHNRYRQRIILILILILIEKNVVVEREAPSLPFPWDTRGVVPGGSRGGVTHHYRRGILSKWPKMPRRFPWYLKTASTF